MDLGYTEKQFIRQTLNALAEGKARIGGQHYSMTISRRDFDILRDKFNEEI